MDNEQWSGLLGSFLDRIGTLLVVYITTSEMRSIQQNIENQVNQDREIREQNERKKFTNDIDTIIADYITDISAYFYANRALERLSQTETGLMEELSEIDKEIYNKYNYEKDVSSDSDKLVECALEIEQLKEKQSAIINRTSNIKNEIMQRRRERTIAVKCYFLLKII